MIETLSFFTFQDTATAIQNGNECVANKASAVTFEITGTSTSRTILFEGLSLSNSWYPIQCANLSTLSLATQTTENNTIWQADISGLLRFRTRIASVSEGNVSIKGKVV
jgi:hypothetical protein